MDDEEILLGMENYAGFMERVTADLALDDFQDEDLRELTEEKTLAHSFVNERYKKDKIKLSSIQISERMKKISPNSIQLDLTDDDDPSEVPTEVNKGVERTSARIPRPQTLSVFSETSEERPMTGRKSHENSAQNSDQKDEEVTRRLLETKAKKQQGTGTARDCRAALPKQNCITQNTSEWSTEDPESVEYCYLDGKIKRQTHVAAFKFVPRHSDELLMEIYDPLHVEVQADDLWFEGLNMRTGDRGIFPSYYAQRVQNNADETPRSEKESPGKFFLYFIGSVEVPCHRGSNVLCQAMYKVAEARREILHSSPPVYVCLKVTNRGVTMTDQSDLKRYRRRTSALAGEKRAFSSSWKVKQKTHFFLLKNVSFCGCHPGNEKYFGFITRHPNGYRFACHTFISESTTRPIIDCFGEAFAMYFQEYTDYVQPSDDMYLE